MILSSFSPCFYKKLEACEKYKKTIISVWICTWSIMGIRPIALARRKHPGRTGSCQFLQIQNRLDTNKSLKKTRWNQKTWVHKYRLRMGERYVKLFAMNVNLCDKKIMILLEGIHWTWMVSMFPTYRSSFLNALDHVRHGVMHKQKFQKHQEIKPKLPA